MRTAAAVILLLLAASIGAGAQEKTIDVAALKKEGTEVLEKAKKFQEDGKLTEAADLYRRILNEFWILVYLKEIDGEDVLGRLRECGLKLVASHLTGAKLSKNKHLDGINGLEFFPPDGWRGIPPMKAFTADSGFQLQGSVKLACRYRFPYLDDLSLIVLKLEDVGSLTEVERTLAKMVERAGPAQQAPGDVLKVAGAEASTRSYALEKSGDRLYAVHLFDRQSDYGFILLTEWDKIGAEADLGPVKKMTHQVAQKFTFAPKRAIDAYRKKYNNGALCAGWKTLKTQHYFIEYATDEPFAKRLGEELELIQKVYTNAVPAKAPIPMCVVKVFPNRDDYFLYSGAYGSAAYWSPLQEEIVCYKFSGGELKKEDTRDTRTIVDRQEAEAVTFKVIYHEGFHQYMHYALGADQSDLYIPSWLNEGMGDYFFGGKVVQRGGKRLLEIGMNDWRQKIIYDAVSQDKHVPLKQLLDYRQADYYANASLCYAQGWALCHFLMNSPNKAYQRFPSAMIEALKQLGNYRVATDECRKALNLDWDKMEAEWKAYVLEKLKP
jgi:hypothetical protein